MLTHRCILIYLLFSKFRNKYLKIKTMSVIFNSTFTADKPIYYPANWGSDKTPQQQIQEIKQGFLYVILRNCLQIIVGSLWIFMIWTLASAIRELKRLKQLPDKNIEKIKNRQYLKKDFVFRLAFIMVIVICVTLGLLVFSYDSRFAMGKGIIGFAICYCGRKWMFEQMKEKENTNQQSLSLNHNKQQ